MYLFKGKYLDINMHAERMSCEGEGRDPGNVSLSQRMPKIASKPLEGRERHGTDFSLSA